MKVVIAAALIGLGFLHYDKRPQPNCQIEAFYFPMSQQTSNPISTESIEQEFDISSLVKHKSKDIVHILEMKDLPSARFDDGLVRLKVKIGSRIIVCDLLGNVKDGKMLYRLNREHYKNLHNLIRNQIPQE